MAVTTAVVSSMAIALTTRAIATTAADTQHAIIMKEMLSAIGTGKTDRNSSPWLSPFFIS